MSIAKFSPNLAAVSSTDGLARALGISTPLFLEVINNVIPSDLYRRHEIVKRAPAKKPASNGITLPPEEQVWANPLPAYRLVWEPSSAPLKLAHKSAAASLRSFLYANVEGFPHPSSYGYIKGRSTRDHASRHKGAKLLFGADIKDFFNSITIGKVELALRQAGLKDSVSTALARFLTINGALPLGLNSSPLISNLVVHAMDRDFSDMADRIGCVYTRYADDITFSSSSALPAREEVIKVFARHGFKPNDEKWRRSKRGQKHYVTGLSVCDFLRPHAPRAMKARLRQELYYISKLGISSHLAKLRGQPTEQSVVNRIDGTVSYIASIEPTLAKRIKDQWASICELQELSRSFEPRPVVNLLDFDWYVDEAEFNKSDGTKMLAIACVHVHRPVEYGRMITQIFDSAIEDAFSSMSSKRNRGFHWSEATLSLQENVSKAISVYPLRCSVVMDSLSDSSYKSVYEKLLAEVVGKMFRTADSAAVRITIERNSSKISEAEVISSVAKAYQLLHDRNERRPVERPKVFVKDKGESVGMTAPDALLGALGAYLKWSSKSAGLVVENFERLRSRYKLIQDFHSNESFHRNNPIRPWLEG